MIIVLALGAVLAPAPLGEGIGDFLGQLASGVTDSSRRNRSAPDGQTPPPARPRRPARRPARRSVPPPRRGSRRQQRRDTQLLLFGFGVVTGLAVVWAAVSWLLTHWWAVIVLGAVATAATAA